ncbi:hypothetical protein BU16DRAFT_371385 [Lophium mytilinum]|uniref:Fungal N-terminal domain-containing protein n=1 Tax=Lophium mytilinum TaxID=390894 RepID=A0A6A6QV22_9PEZI|nr:hypothetical protein BU16DRAFT_371385 [Lophium mytilinum]
MPAFGYSVGDCVASVDLLVRIIKALRDSGGSASEFQQLQIDLEFLGAVLNQLKILDLVPSGTSASQIDTATRFVQSTQGALSALLEKVGKFKDSLAKSPLRGKLPSALRKAQWALMYSNDIAKLRQKLTNNTISLNLFLETQSVGHSKAMALAFTSS